MANYIAHHGVKGQKWGVQNGPPYPLDKQAADNSKQRIQEMRKKLVFKAFDDDKTRTILKEDINISRLSEMARKDFEKIEPKANRLNEIIASYANDTGIDESVFYEAFYNKLDNSEASTTLNENTVLSKAYRMYYDSKQQYKASCRDLAASYAKQIDDGKTKGDWGATYRAVNDLIKAGVSANLFQDSFEKEIYNQLGRYEYEDPDPDELKRATKYIESDIIRSNK